MPPKQKKKSPKRHLRDIQRELRREDLPATIRQSHERLVEVLREEIRIRTLNSLERKMTKKYKMVRFFEKRKITRKLHQAALKLFLLDKKKKLGEEEKKQVEELKSDILKAKMDLNFIQYFPKTRKYIALYPAEPIVSKRILEERDEIYATISTAANADELTQAPGMFNKSEASHIFAIQRYGRENPKAHAPQLVSNIIPSGLLKDESELMNRYGALAVGGDDIDVNAVEPEIGVKEEDEHKAAHISKPIKFKSAASVQSKNGNNKNKGKDSDSDEDDESDDDSDNSGSDSGSDSDSDSDGGSDDDSDSDSDNDSGSDSDSDSDDEEGGKKKKSKKKADKKGKKKSSSAAKTPQPEPVIPKIPGTVESDPTVAAVAKLISKAKKKVKGPILDEKSAKKMKEINEKYAPRKIFSDKPLREYPSAQEKKAKKLAAQRASGFVPHHAPAGGSPRGARGGRGGRGGGGSRGGSPRGGFADRGGSPRGGFSDRGGRGGFGGQTFSPRGGSGSFRGSSPRSHSAAGDSFFQK